MTATITFADGSSIVAEKQGDFLILDEMPEFPEDRSRVTVTVGTVNTVYRYFIVMQYESMDGRYWFRFDEPTGEALATLDLKAQNDMLIECILEMSEIIYGE